MKQLQRVVTLALALLLIGLPAVTLAQTSGSGSSAPAAGSGTDKPATGSGSASPGTSTGTGSSAGQASPAMPASAEECKNNGWQKFQGVKSEAECISKVKK
jgi:hypothetical protein